MGDEVLMRPEIYNAIFNKFLLVSGVNEDNISYWQPARRPYITKDTSNAIVVYLRGKGSIIYAADPEIKFV